MAHGLQIFSPDGRTLFDSNIALGGVCIGMITIPAQAYGEAVRDFIYSYPEHGPGRQGFVLNDIGGRSAAGPEYYYDNVLGYGRFVFQGRTYPRTVVLFMK